MDARCHAREDARVAPALAVEDVNIIVVAVVHMAAMVPAEETVRVHAICPVKVLAAEDVQVRITQILHGNLWIFFIS